MKTLEKFLFTFKTYITCFVINYTKEEQKKIQTYMYMIITLKTFEAKWVNSVRTNLIKSNYWYTPKTYKINM